MMLNAMKPRLEILTKFMVYSVLQPIGLSKICFILGIYIENLAEYACHSPLDVLELLRMGQKKLIFAETRMNRRSSR